MAGWKKKLLSFARRLTLVKAVTSALPVYYLSLFKMPVGVAEEFDRLQASFLWGGSELKRKIYMIKWEELSKRVDRGGLGIRKVKEVNSCLLIKWWWRFGCESKYKFDVRSWFLSFSLSGRHSVIWKGIISIAEQCNTLKDFYMMNCHLKVGDRSRTNFWTDIWC